MELTFWAATDVGKKREHNEDNFLVDTKLSLFVVADGMGGHASGEVASHLAVHELRNSIEGRREVIEGYAKSDGKVTTQELLSVMEHAVQAACAAIFQKGSSAASAGDVCAGGFPDGIQTALMPRASKSSSSASFGGSCTIAWRASSL